MSGDQHSSVHRPESWFVAASGAEVESSAPPVPGLTAAAKNDQRWAGEAAETEREQQQEPTQAGTRKWLRAVKGELTPPQSWCVSWRGGSPGRCASALLRVQRVAPAIAGQFGGVKVREIIEGELVACGGEADHHRRSERLEG